MKEKKKILMMLFTLAFMVLIYAVISAFFDSILVLKTYRFSRYKIILGILENITSILGIVFCVFYILGFCMKKSKLLTILQNTSAMVVLVFFIVSAILLRVNLKHLTRIEYSTLFNVMLNIIISEMIVFISSFCIKRITRKEQKEEQKALEQKQLEQNASNEQEETI